MTRHRSTAYIDATAGRGRGWKPAPITDQFRFIVRLAYACNSQGISYAVEWDRHGPRMRATITATGKIPIPKPLPKAPRLKLVSDWKPSVWDAAYRLEAYHDPARKRMCPGFVIEHSSGLALVHPSELGELGVTGDGGNEDIRQNWLVTHAASGIGFGLTLNFKRATDALLLAASFSVDWMQSADSLMADLDSRRAGNTVIATYGTAHDKDVAKRRLADLEYKRRSENRPVNAA